MYNDFGINGKLYSTEFREYNSGVGGWWRVGIITNKISTYYNNYLSSTLKKLILIIILKK